ncbi:AlpA family phage regulatory protein [Silvimonas sp.]|uniref:AlpA family phage regulatory protein n=1 Tax=Silvimonas sp. TaxID=2650811 RepID=UPI00284EF096|nr:AlpA family phage regulatory protein [Silvimonas sp.]MDR3428219.1 AlpA family phage regulatory protein [Silvimonas sp.]
MSSSTNKPSRYIERLPSVMERTGYRRSSIYQMMKDGSFPKCRKLGPRAVGWDPDLIDAWIEARLNAEG